MDEAREREILDRISAEGAGAWDFFLEACADVIFRVVRLHADTYDDRMELFLSVCARLREDDMRRLRAFRKRPEAPCRFSTWLSVVARNLAVDAVRSREGRYRPFRSIEAMEEADRLVFEYHLHEGRPLGEVRDLLARRHGIRMTDPDLSARAARVHSSLTASQRWRLLARLAQARRPLSLDPVSGVAIAADRPLPLRGSDGNPERPLREREARKALLEAIQSLPPRGRLALALRYSDGMPAADVAAFLGMRPAEAERLARESLEAVKAGLRRSGIARVDLEAIEAATWDSA